ncbi:MAG: hypothetical protein RL322_2501 [Pseudomonadota bacterium]
MHTADFDRTALALACKRFQIDRRRALGRTSMVALTGLGAAATPGPALGMAARAVAQPADSGPLIVAAYPALDRILKALEPDWTAKHPKTPIKIVSRSFGDHHAAITAALATRKGLPDLMAVEFGYLARFAGSGALADLGPLLGRAGLLDGVIVPYAARQARFGGRLLALPTDIGPGVTFYRDDLLATARVSPETFLESWESFVDAGRRIRDATGARLVGHARDLKDAIIRSGIQPGEGLYFDADGRPVVRSSRFERAFSLARAARQADLDARVPAWSNDWSEGLRRGGIASQLTGAWFGGHLATWLAPSTTGKWRSALLPGGAMTAWGGSFFAIPAGSPRKAEALELLKLIAFDPVRQIDAFRRHDAFPALLAAHDDPFFGEPLAFFGGQRARMLWRDVARKIVPISVHRLDPLADEIVNVELDRVLLRGKAVSSALADAQALLERRVARASR